MDLPNQRDLPRQPPNEFATTHWSLVLHAGKRGSEDAERALETLCRQYWYPLYAYVRRRVADVHQAQDLTQSFFARLLEKNVLAAAEPERGRFRGFLLTAMKNFLANEWDKAGAQKRGGARQRLPLDFDSGESRFSLEPAHEATPERLYERQWALTFLQLVMDRLQTELAAAGKARQFELLKEALSGSGQGLSHSAAAAELGMSEEAVRQAAHRLRKRYRELLRAEVAQTVSNADEVDEEIRSLFETLGP